MASVEVEAAEGKMIHIYREIKVEITGEEISFPDGKFKRTKEAQIIGSALARGFFLRHCDESFNDKVELQVYGYAGLM